jgi:protease-4
MKFARAVWSILVAIKDGLVLLLLLLFFGGLSLALSNHPTAARVQEGALAITLDGPVVEERPKVEARALLLGGGKPHRQYLARDVVRVIEAASSDARIHAVTLDLEDFGGASRVTLSRIGAAIDKVRHAGKPVLVRAVLYEDGAYQLAAHASEVWVDPLGGVMLRGPGGTMLFYHDLLDRLKVKAHVFKVGTYKSAVEPFVRNNLSPEAKAAETQVYGALWHQWQDEVKAARPHADLVLATTDPVKWLNASGGDTAKAALAAGLADRIGDKVAFGKRVAELVGKDKSGNTAPNALAYKATRYGTYLAHLPANDQGKAIAVVTVAGDIVDGDAGPGTAGGDRIAALIDKAAASGDYAGMVVRVDSPGGSVMASERIRSAIARFKAKGAPVAVSMGGLAASGGYWVSTPADRIFAEPNTITGSIGIFAVIPTFEDTLGKFGIGTDGVRTTPLSGQPDVLGGLSPAMEGVLQADIDMGYRRFVGLVATSRHQTPEAIDKIAQGRIWDGGTARQIGLVDEFGDLDQALAWVAHRAKAATYHPAYLGEVADGFAGFLQQLFDDDGQGDTPDDSTHAGAHDLVGRVALAQSALAGQLAGDLERLLGGHGAQAYCLECAGLTSPAGNTLADSAQRAQWLSMVFNAPR